MLPLRARVDLGAMAMKGYSTFPKAPTLLEPHHQIFNVISRTLVGGGSYPSAEKQSVYSTAPADWANYGRDVVNHSGLFAWHDSVMVAGRFK